MNRGIAEYADNEDEVAMVIAHEIGHQSANHVATGQRNQMVGALVGAVLLGAVDALASYRSPNAGNITSSAMQAGGDIGAVIGRISFSKEQEREADYLAAGSAFLSRYYSSQSRLRAPRDGRWPDSDHQSLTDPPERGSAIRNLADAATNCYEIDRIRSVTTAPKAF